MSQKFYQDFQAANKHNSVTVFSATLKISKSSYLYYVLWCDFWLWLKSSFFSDLSVFMIHVSCIRKQLLIFFFYLFNQNKSWRIILMKFLYQSECIFLYHHIWFSCSLFIFFSFNQKFKSCEFHVSFHVINQVNKVQIFFIFNNHELWWQHLSADWIIFWKS